MAYGEIERTKRAEKLETFAERIQGEIDFCFKERLENTPKRAREAESMRESGRYLKLMQDKLRALAAAWREDSVPPSLVGIHTKTSIDAMLTWQAYPQKINGWNEAAVNNLAKADINSEETFQAARAALLALGDPSAGQKSDADKIKDIERELIGLKIDGYFPTPREVVEQMLDYADIQPGHKVFEPSAGKGNIADAIRERHSDITLSVGEVVPRLRGILELKGYNLISIDFLGFKHAKVGSFDRVIQNPPFEKFQDIEHVYHAYKHLRSGGRLVSLMSEAPFTSSRAYADGFRAWLEAIQENGAVVEVEKLPPGAFAKAERPTGVAMRLVVIDKPEAVAAAPATSGQVCFQRLSTAQAEAYVHRLYAEVRLRFDATWYIGFGDLPVQIAQEGNYDEVFYLQDKDGEDVEQIVIVGRYPTPTAPAEPARPVLQIAGGRFDVPDDKPVQLTLF